jgi:hypothetical protein
MVDLQYYGLPDLGIDIAAPTSWTFTADDPAADAVFSADEAHGFRTNVALTLDRLDPPTPERFEEIITELPALLAARDDNAEVHLDRRFAQEGMPAWLVRYSRQPDGAAHAFEQVMALIVVALDQGAVVQFDATTIGPLAEDHLPLVQAMLSSVRPFKHSDD